MKSEGGRLNDAKVLTQDAKFPMEFELGSLKSK